MEILTRSTTGQEGWRPTRGCTCWTAGWNVTQAESLSFLGLNFLMGYHRLLKLEHYWEMKPGTGFRLGLFQQSVTRERLKFISKHIAMTSPAEMEENDRYRERRDPLGRIRWLIHNLNAQFGNCRQSPRAQSIDESRKTKQHRRSRKTEVSRRKLVRKPLRITESTWKV